MRADGLAIHLYKGGWRVYRMAGAVPYDETLPEQDGKDPEECAEGAESLMVFIREGVVQVVRMERGQLEIAGATAPVREADKP